jgi:hypothetical protein
VNILLDNPMTQFSFEWILSLNWLRQKWGQVQIATNIAPTSLNLGASFYVDGNFYAFHLVPVGFNAFGPVAISQPETLDLANGITSFVRATDPATGPIFGAAPVRGHSQSQLPVPGQRRLRWRVSE